MAQLLSNLPVGAKVKFGKHSINGETAQPIIWVVVAKNHPGYPSNSITFLTEKIIDLRCYDAVESGAEYGNHRYSISNIDQWLNKDSEAGNWYVAAHSGDAPPDTSQSVANRHTQYAARPGFLHFFDTKEKNALLNTSIKCWNGKSGIDVETIVRKMFLLSFYEIGKSGNGLSVDGEVIPYVRDSVIATTLTEQVNAYSQSDLKQNAWMTRSVRQVDGVTYPQIRVVNVEGNTYDGYPYGGFSGIRPAMNLNETTKVSDKTDSDGCYTIVWNSSPTQPTTIDVPILYGGKTNSISWGKATDPDGDTLTYQLECSVNGGAYTQIYSGASTTYAHLVPFGTTSVAYRVKATDPSGESSAYTTSATKTVINNNAPVISGVDANLGVKSSGFTGTYTVTDANNNAVTVTEAIDGVQIRSLVATLGATITYGITDNTWLALPNGSHTLTIRATDGIDTSIRTYTFTKLVNEFTIRNSTPWASSTMPTRIMLVITRNIPPTSTFKVEVCNNGYDVSPTWEDCTDAVMSGLVHVLTNKTKTAANWGVLVRVTVARNGATGACYVSAIGGNFE
jgi:hypothetical protein